MFKFQKQKNQKRDCVKYSLFPIPLLEEIEMKKIPLISYHPIKICQNVGKVGFALALPTLH
jgi:hypothetical protein